MRIRLPFAGIFISLLLLAAYLGLAPSPTSPLPINDKALHFLTFLLLTTAFYWVIDTTRRRTLHLTLLVCTFGLAIGSEVLQAVLPGNGRAFDIFDVVANVAGSGVAVGICGVYHARMMERRRVRKYTAVPTAGDEVGEGELDLELGEGVGAGHEEGVTVSSGGGGERATTLEEEVDNWDENAVDPWDEDDTGDVGAAATHSVGKEGEGNGGGPKKRSD